MPSPRRRANGWILILTLLAFAPTRGLAQQTPDTPLGVVRYDITLVPDFQSNRVDVSARLAVRNFSAQRQSKVELSLLSPDAQEEMTVEVTDFARAEGNRRSSLPFERSLRAVAPGGSAGWTVISIPLPAALEPGAEITLACSYVLRGVAPASGLPIFTDAAGARELYLIRDSEWLPTVMGNPAPGMFANAPRPAWRLTVRHPSDMVAVIDGTLADRKTTDGMTTATWTSAIGGLPQVLISRYDVVTSRHGNYEVETYIPPEAGLRKEAEQMAADVGRTLPVFAALFGTPASSVYRVVTTRADNGGHSLHMGQAIQASIMRVQSFHTVAHELAHTWWGMSVSSYGAGSRFLRESLAEFSAAWAIRESRGDTAFRRALAGWKVEAFCPMPARTTTADAAAPLIEQPGVDHNRIRRASYSRGPLAANELRLELGDAPFFAGLARFARDFADRNATISDFISTFSRVAGRDLSAFFRELLWDSASASYELLGFQSDGSGASHRTTVRIRNGGAAGRWCELALTSGDTVTRERVRVDAGATREFSFTTASPVTQVTLDPDLVAYDYAPDRALSLWARYDESSFENQNWLWFNKSFALHRLGDTAGAAGLLSRYIDAHMQNKRLASLADYGQDPLNACYLFWRGVYALRLGDRPGAEAAVRASIPGLAMLFSDERLTSLLAVGTGLAPAVDTERELAGLLAALTGLAAPAVAGMPPPERKKAVSGWLTSWQASAKNAPIDLSPLRRY